MKKVSASHAVNEPCTSQLRNDRFAALIERRTEADLEYT